MKMTCLLPVALVFAAGLAVAQVPAYPVKSVRPWYRHPRAAAPTYSRACSRKK